MSSLSESERQRRIQVLKLILKDLDRPVRQPYPRIDTEREEAAKDEARAAGRELLTPLAACRLFNKSAPTVRRAVSEGRVWAPFTLNATGKSMALISLESATSYWEEFTPDDLEIMRDNGQTLGVKGLVYNILSPEPLVSLRNLEEQE